MSKPSHERTFQGAITLAKTWPEQRFSKTEAFLLIAHCRSVLRSPADYPELVEIWNGFFDIQAAIKDRYEQMDWSETTGQVLVLLGELQINIFKGIGNFLPPSIARTFTREDMEALWCWYLLNLGIKLKPEDPYCLLYPFAMILMSRPYVEREFVIRRLKHPEEFDGGMIAYCRRTGVDKLPEAEELLSAAAKGIALTLQKTLSRKTRDFLSERSNYGRDNFFDALVETALFDGYHGTPEEIMAKSLDAQLGVVTAAANDIRDEQRFELPKPIKKLLREADEITRRAKKDNRELSGDEKKRLEQIPDEISMTKQQIDDATTNVDFAVENATPEQLVSTHRRVDEFMTEYPKEWALIKSSKLDGASNKELAKQEGLSEARISQKLKDALIVFYKFLDD